MQENRVISESEELFNLWKEDRITKAFFSFLRRSREAQRESWELGEFVGPDLYKNVAVNAKALGICDTLRLIEDIKYDDLFGEHDE